MTAGTVDGSAEANTSAPTARADTHPGAPPGWIVLTREDLTAVIDPHGAALRALSQAGRDLIVPFDHVSRSPAYGGSLLAPWPNRIVSGRYLFDSTTPLRLPITEPERGHALHGLLTEEVFSRRTSGPDSLVLTAAIMPRPGYPWHLEIEVEFTLRETGLTQVVSATNRSHTTAPYGVGAHPYLRAGDGPLDAWELLLPAERVQLTTGDRMLPAAVESVSVDPRRFDFRRPRRIGGAQIDHAFTGLARQDDGSAEVTLRGPDGLGVRMRWDTSCPWVQVCTADLPDPELTRCGLAVEAMTCPPDAFNSGVDLIRLSPDETRETSWSIGPLQRDTSLRLVA